LRRQGRSKSKNFYETRDIQKIIKNQRKVKVDEIFEDSREVKGGPGINVDET
jgi:hypothetical protein